MMNVKKVISVFIVTMIIIMGNSLTAEASTYKYPVKSGDTLWKIANYNKVSVPNLKEWNGLNSDMIYIGQKLYVFDPHRPKGSEKNTSSTHKKFTAKYTIQPGDTLWKIASWNNMTVDSIKTANGLKSDLIYIGQVLTINGNTVAQGNQTNNIVNIITEGKKYIGVPYVWGGSDPSGFDCSGFLNYVYAKNGVHIPRTVESIWNVGTWVNSPSVGDIVFFETYKPGASHAGIYLGNGEFLHAGESSGVTVSNMSNNSYWAPKYIGAKRLH